MEKILKNKKRTYDAVGFVEALIAIMVSGIAATVLLSIAAISMRELIRMDMQDAISQHARSGAVIVQNIANRESLKDDSEVFESLGIGLCYSVDFEGGLYVFDLGNPFDSNARNAYKDEAVIPVNDEFPGDETEYFRVVCIEKKEGRRVLVKIIVGVRKMQGVRTTPSDIKDFVYFSVINI